MKKLFYILTVSLLSIVGFGSFIVAAPQSAGNIFRNITPEANNTYYNATSSVQWKETHSDKFCIDGSCISSWSSIANNPFNQWLDTTNTPEFAGLVVNGNATTTGVQNVGSLTIGSLTGVLEAVGGTVRTTSSPTFSAVSSTNLYAATGNFDNLYAQAIGSASNRVPLLYADTIRTQWLEVSQNFIDSSIKIGSSTNALSADLYFQNTGGLGSLSYGLDGLFTLNAGLTISGNATATNVTTTNLYVSALANMGTTTLANLTVSNNSTSTINGDVVMSHPFFLTTHGIRGDASDGTQIIANNHTQVASFGVGNSANSLFYGGVVINTTLSAGSSTLTNLTVSNNTTSTFTGGIQVNGGTLTVDAINNRVGIGSLNPLSIFEVKGNATGSRVTLTNTDSSIDPNDSLGIIDFYSLDTSSGAAGIAASIQAQSQGGHVASNRNADLVFYTTPNNTTLTEAMRLSRNGFLGLHELAPESEIEVTDATGDSYITVTNNTDDKFSGLYFKRARTGSAETGGAAIRIQSDTAIANAQLEFHVLSSMAFGNTYDNTGAFLIGGNAGGVGVGRFATPTTAPSANLHVVPFLRTATTGTSTATNGSNLFPTSGDLTVHFTVGDAIRITNPDTAPDEEFYSTVTAITSAQITTLNTYTGTNTTAATVSKASVTHDALRVDDGAGQEIFSISPQRVAVWNESGLSTADFRMKGDTNTSLFFMDASADRIGINHSSPASKLHVVEDSDSDVTVLTVSADGVSATGVRPNAGIEFRGPITTGATIFDAARILGGFTSAGSGFARAGFTIQLPTANDTWINAMKWDNYGDITWGSGKADQDYSLTVDGETNDGLLQFMEDEDAWYFADKIGIGTTTPAGQLHVIQGTLSGSMTPSTLGDALVVEDDQTAGITIRSSLTNSILFSDAANNVVGSIIYAHATNVLSLTVSSTAALTLNMATTTISNNFVGSRTKLCAAKGAGLVGAISASTYFDLENETMAADWGFPMAQAGSIVGVSMTADVDTVSVAGTFTIQVRKNGTSVFSTTTASVSATGATSVWENQPRNTDTFAAGDDLQLYVDFTSFNGDVDRFSGCIDIQLDQ